jgi:hypothetical protein
MVGSTRADASAKHIPQEVGCINADFLKGYNKTSCHSREGGNPVPVILEILKDKVLMIQR